jgi:uncharacterized protein involved in exopolysaccharide biosynthesis
MDESHNTGIETAVWINADEGGLVESVEEAAEDFSVKIVHFAQLYWKKRELALAIIGVGIVLSVAYALMLRNIYTSSTSLMPPDNSSPYSSMLSMLSGSSTAASLGSEALGLSTPGELLVSILQSRTVQDALIARFDLMHYYKARVVEDARKSLSSNTNIDQDRKSGIITINVVDKDADFACKLAQGYVNELNRVMTENSTSAARRERIFLEERLKGVKQDLDDSSLALSQFSTRSRAIDIPGQARSMMEASMRIQGMLAESQSQLAALRQTYSEDNYRVKAVEARNAELLRQYNALGGVSKATTSTTKANTPYPSAGDLPTLGLTYYDLDRKVRVDEALWETLTKQYEMARVQEAKEIPTIRVLDTANVPNRKSAPHRSVIVLIGTFLSLVLSCIAVLGLNHWQELDNDLEPKKFLMQVFGRAPQIQPLK